MNEPIEALYVGNMEIAGMEIPCAVLIDDRRVVTEHGVAQILGGRSGASLRRKYANRDKGRAPLPLFLAPKRLKPYINKYLSGDPLEPIIYKHKTTTISAFDCRILPNICRVWIEAALNGDLLPQQMPKTMNALSFLNGLGELGIIGLVDEATGYQTIRDKRELHKILDAYLRPEHAKWAKRFPDEFYRHIFRLRDWEWQGMKVNRPSVVGRYTNDIVWDRIATGIRKELEERNPKTESGRRKVKHHQFLTDDIGHPALEKHLEGVMALMRASSNWSRFKGSLARAYKKLGDQLDFEKLDD